LNNLRSALICLTIVVALLLLLARGEQWGRRLLGLSVGQDRMWEAIGTCDLTALRQAFVEGAQVNVAHPRQLELPLEMAISTHDARLVAEMLRHGAEPNRSSWDEFTPLQRAIVVEDPEVLKLLLSAGADVNASPSRPPLMMAIRLKSAAMTDILLSAGADPLQCDAKGDSPMKLAMETKDAELIRKVRRAQAPRLALTAPTRGAGRSGPVRVAGLMRSIIAAGNRG
jgi:hypothetical protein